MAKEAARGDDLFGAPQIGLRSGHAADPAAEQE
jgi:hypothetical protein